MEGQPSRGVFLLCQGRAKLSTSDKEGRTVILRIAKPGEVRGLHATVLNEPYELTVETMQPCQLNFINRISASLTGRKLQDEPCSCQSEQFSNVPRIS